MAGLALVMVIIILLAGQPDAPAGPAPTSGAVQPPNADRVREYQDRLRAAEAQAAREAQTAALSTQQSPLMLYEEPRAAAPEDPIATDRRRREYESLFASNVVLSRRPEGERPDTGGRSPVGTTATDFLREPPSSSLDEIADAVVRATARTGSGTSAPSTATPPVTEDTGGASAPTRTPERVVRPERKDAISAAGPLHRLVEGTLIDAVLTNRLEGSVAAPVNCLVTNPVYSHSGQHVLIPAGARVLGETKPVQAFGETRLAVAFHRLLMPDGRTVSLDQFLGLNQVGDTGLRDRVNQHYLSTFGAAGAVGLISGLAQWLGTAGFSRGNGDRTIIIAGGATDATSQATLQMMNRFLNRLPTVTIREGQRVKVYLTSDVELPAYEPSVPGRF
jgi:type IV secretion system protein VirB10